MRHRVRRVVPALTLLALFSGSTTIDAGEPIPTPIVCLPDDVLPDEATAVYVYGGDYRPETRIRVEGVGDLIDQIVLTPELIVGYTPPLDPANPNQPPGRKDIVAVTGELTATLRDGVLYVDYGEPYLKFCWPSEVGPEGGTLLHFYGRNFHASLIPGFEGAPCTDPVFVSDTEITALSPTLEARPLGPFYTGELRDGPGGPVVTDRESMLAVYGPTPLPVLTAVEPFEVDARGGSFITVRGTDLRNNGQTALYVARQGVSIGGVDGRVLVEGDDPVKAIDGVSPRVDPLDPATPPGIYDVVYRDARAEVVLSGGIRYLDKIRSVTPSRVAAAGGTPVTFEGYEFEVDWVPYLGGQPIESFSLDGSTTATGLSPPLAPGLHAATFVDEEGNVVGYLPDAVEAVGSTKVTIAAVTPSTFAAPGGVEVVFAGTGFRAGLVPELGALPLTGSMLVDAEHIRGFAPELAEAKHAAVLRDEAGEVVAVLDGAVLVTGPPEPLPPGPEEVEAVYAEGVARFTWTNPIPYREIIARDLAGNILAELAGSETSLRLLAGREGLGIQLEPLTAENVRARISYAYAFPANCDLPAPLGGYGFSGKFDFPLYGGNLPLRPGRCGPVGIGAEEGDGAGAGVGGARSWDAINGFLQPPGIIGYAVTARDRLAIDDIIRYGLEGHAYTNRLVTGFTLPSDADRLQIDGFYQKLAEDSGLELKGQLIHVFPEDGFQDEFTFPDVFPGEPKFWNGLGYFRSDCDVGLGGAVPNGLRIPAGDYLLHLYAVNGDPNQSFYAFSDDGRDQELLVPGAPCPPYPLVRVLDLTGRSTLPDVSRVLARPVGPDRVEFRAIGNWSDGSGGPASFHSIDPADRESYVPHNFEFCWSIESSIPAGTQSSLSSNVLVSRVRTLGCYRVELVVRDRACNRSTRRVFQAIAEPDGVACRAPFYSVVHPVPDPAGMVAVAGLNPPPGAGSMKEPRPFVATVLVAPRGFCSADPSAVAAEVGDIEFQLAWWTLDSRIKVVALPPEEVSVRNLCASARSSVLRYFEVTIPDLGRARPFLPTVLPGGVVDPGAAAGRLAPVSLQARTRVFRTRTPQGGIRADIVTDQWEDVGSPFLMTNAPSSLGRSNWRGFFSPQDQTYRFVSQAAGDYLEDFAIGASRSIPIGIVPGVSLPAFPNTLSSGLNSAFELANGLWKEGTAIVDSAGEIMGNKLTGAPLQIEGIKRGLREQTTFEWCREQEIYQNAFEQPLFNAVVFTGFIGPIPVTVWASVSLAIRFGLTAQAGTVISAFSALEGGHFFESDLYLKSELGIDVPASIRADVLLGVASVEVRVIPSVTSELTAHVGAEDTRLSSGLRFDLLLSLATQLRACFFSFLCFSSPRVPIIPQTTLLSQRVGDPFEVEECPGGGGGGAALAPAARAGEEGGGAGGDVVISLASHFPAVKASPDGRSAVEVIYEQRNIPPEVFTIVQVRVGTEAVALLGAGPAITSDIEPSIGWISNRRALIAWTRPDPAASGIAPRPADQYSLAELNLVEAQNDIVVTTVEAEPVPFWSYNGAGFRVSDDRAEVPAPADRRVDGRATVAGDVTREEALVAWVRIDDPEYFKAEPGLTTVYVPVGAGGQPPFEPRQVPTVRPHLETASVYARRVGFSGPLGPPQRISSPGINVEPTAAYSPTGNRAYCVWVHDPGHIDLVGSNRGRNLVYAVYDPAADAWSAPQPVLTSPDDLPGLLEPSIALTGDGQGLLAFTALDPSADLLDTGIVGANRSVYISRLIGGVFGPPMRVHGKCQKRVYGSQVRIEIPARGQDPIERVLRRPEIYMFFQQGGTPGSPEASGGLMVSMLADLASNPSPAAAVQGEGTVRSNVAATITEGGIRAVSLNGGPSRISLAALRGEDGAGAGPPAESFYESSEVAVAPDLAVASCTLSNQFPGPGALVAAAVVVENLGLEGSRVTKAGESLVGLRAVYMEPDGAERVAAEAPVPFVPAGGSATVNLTLEQPLDPVRLRVELSPNPLDGNAANDSRQCFFGTPEPEDFACETVRLDDDEESLAVKLTWRNPVPYEEIVLYRDGARIASIPGACTAYVDRLAAEGLHTYEVRGRVEVSKSCRVSLACELVPPEVEPTFRRGDQNASGSIDISDAVAVLGFLFLGGREPACRDAADADDSGSLDITDAVRVLNYLFLGGAAPPAPGPTDCGEDPTPDALSCTASCGGE